MISTEKSSLRTIGAAAKVKTKFFTACAALLLAAAPLFSSPDNSAPIRSVLTMPTAAGLRTLDSLSASKGTPESLRAQSLKLLGDHAFAKENYKKAAEFYSRASRLDNSSVYRHLHALSAALDGQTEAAAEIWDDIAEDLGDTLHALAALHLAYLEMQASNWQEAYSILQSAAPADTASPLYVPFVWEMLECSRQMRRSDRVSLHEKQLSVIKGSILEVSGSSSQLPVASSQLPAAGNQRNDERNRNTAINTDAKAKPDVNVSANINVTENVERSENAAQRNTNQRRREAAFTIQVGAFGSRENAENLVRRLSESYSNVIMMQPAIGGPVLYRVRVGEFERREEAEALAKKLSEAGMSPRIVER